MNLLGLSKVKNALFLEAKNEFRTKVMTSDSKASYCMTLTLQPQSLKGKCL